MKASLPHPSTTFPVRMGAWRRAGCETDGQFADGLHIGERSSIYRQAECQTECHFNLTFPFPYIGGGLQERFGSHKQREGVSTPTGDGNVVVTAVWSPRTWRSTPRPFRYYRRRISRAFRDCTSGLPSAEF